MNLFSFGHNLPSGMVDRNGLDWIDTSLLPPTLPPNIPPIKWPPYPPSGPVITTPTTPWEPYDGPLDSTPVVYWQMPLCPRSQETRAVQVTWWTAGILHPTPFGVIDDGWWGLSGSAFYPHVTEGGLFTDQPSSHSELYGTHFEVCRACVCSGKIVSLGPCKQWRYRDYSQDLAQCGETRFPSDVFIQMLNAHFPGASITTIYE